MEIWNEVAPRYHRRWATATLGPFQSTEKLVEHVGVQRGFDVLDVACGTGAVTKKLSQKVGRSGRVVAADTSVAAIKIAQRYNRDSPNILFVNSDAENFAFGQKFDVITCQYALFFFPDAGKALKNMRRNLKESGRLGISVHGHRDRVPFFGAICGAVAQFVPDFVPPGTPDLDRYGTKRSLRDEVKRSGFSDISVHDYIFRYSPGRFDDYWTDYIRYVARPIREKLSALGRLQREELREKVRENTEPFTDKNGNIQFPWQVLILTAKN